MIYYTLTNYLTCMDIKCKSTLKDGSNRIKFKKI